MILEFKNIANDSYLPNIYVHFTKLPIGLYIQVILMDRKSVFAIVAAVIIVVAAVGAYAVINNGNNGTEKEKVQYDPSKGWYSWDPTVIKYPTGKLSFSPQLIDTVESMYKSVYGELPDYSKYTADMVPSDFLSYDSMVFNDTEDQVTVISQIRVASGSSDYKQLAVTLDKGTNKLITVGSNAALLKMMFAESMTDSEAQAKVWDIVYGLDSSAFPGGSVDLEKTYNMPVPSTVTKVSSTYYLVKNIDEYTGYVNDVTKTGDNLVLMFSGALGNSYADLKPFYDMLSSANVNNTGNAYLVGTFSTDLSDVFSGIEILGAMFDVKDVAHKYIDSLRLKFWAMHTESANSGKDYTVYIESAGGTAAGKGTIINDVVTNVLSLTNIFDHEQWQKMSDEVIVDKQPDVLIFQESDKRSDDEMMRKG